MTLTPILAPFPYFGGKSRIAPAIWAHLGDVRNYVEPFCGSAAMVLRAPALPPTVTLNDADGFLVNFYRAVQADPEAVAAWLDYPVSEIDLFARHVWLLRHTDELAERLMCDPEFSDPKIAGWWCWGVCSWIGTGWCSGDGPWSVAHDTVINIRPNAGRGVHRQLPHLGAGRGVHRQLPHLGAGRGVRRKLPHLGAGRGVHRKLPHLGAGCGVHRQHLEHYMREIAERLRGARITCGDWRRVLTPGITHRFGVTAIMLDPPYGEGAMDYAAGGNTTTTIARDVWDWAVHNGDHPLLRIAVCGYEDDRALPSGWTAMPWKARKGYQKSATNSHREVVWFSPHCIGTP